MPDTDRWSATDGVMNALSASAVAGAVLFEIVARANGLGGPYWTFFSPDVFVQCGLLSVFVYHAWRVHDWRETVAALVLAAIAFPLIRSAGFSFVRSQTQALAYAAMVGSGGVQLAALVRAFGVAGQRMLRLRLARPKANVLDAAMIAALDAALAEHAGAQSRPRIDDIVIRGWFASIHEGSAAERAQLRRLLRDFRLTVVGPRPIGEAIITAGGVAVNELDPRTLESKRVRGLYCCGEVIDVDADTGGYNLQAAFSTGYLAGEAAAKALGYGL